MSLGFRAVAYMFEGGEVPTPLGEWLCVLKKVSDLEIFKKG